MAAHRIPGNEPDSQDMAQEPAIPGAPASTEPLDPGLAGEEEEAAKLGDFA